jgi:predicted HAD superfamily Cof-like phosphohydrolase
MDLNDIPALDQIKVWFEKAVPSPDLINLSTQIGVHLEEVSEMLDTIIGVSENQETLDRMTLYRDMVADAAKQFKSPGSRFCLDLRYVDRPMLLDALCDQIVTAIGVAHMMNLDIKGALKEVANSNDSKFDEDGQPIFNSHRKIMKGPNYKAPDLSQYI